MNLSHSLQVLEHSRLNHCCQTWSTPLTTTQWHKVLRAMIWIPWLWVSRTQSYLTVRRQKARTEGTHPVVTAISYFKSRETDEIFLILGNPSKNFPNIVNTFLWKCYCGFQKVHLSQLKGEGFIELHTFFEVFKRIRIKKHQYLKSLSKYTFRHPKKLIFK